MHRVGGVREAHKRQGLGTTSPHRKAVRRGLPGEVLGCRLMMLLAQGWEPRAAELASPWRCGKPRGAGQGKTPGSTRPRAATLQMWSLRMGW